MGEAVNGKKHYPVDAFTDPAVLTIHRLSDSPIHRFFRMGAGIIELSEGFLKALKGKSTRAVRSGPRGGHRAMRAFLLAFSRLLVTG